MKKVIFLENAQGSLNGINVKNFNKDSIYNVDGVQINNYLFDSWLKKGILEEVIEEKMLPKFENKAILSAPENKEEELSKIVEEDSENKEEIKINNKKKGKK
jgi:hypothetical protein